MTMRAFTATELERMQGTQESAMQDRCYLRTYLPGGGDEYGVPERVLVEGEELVCGLEMLKFNEAEQAEAAMFDAWLRLPIDTDVTAADEVRIVQRYDEVLSESVTYQVFGEAERGPSGLMLRLKRVG